MVTHYHIGHSTLDRENFILSDVEAITSFRRSDLHNHIKRGILKYLGTGGAGRKRQFGLVGLYESGIVEALAQTGLTLVEAAQVVHRSLCFAEVSAIMALRADGNTTEQAENAIQKQPKWLLRGEWSPAACSRDLASPYLWVFLKDALRGAMIEVVKGWPDVPRAVRNVISRSHAGYLALTPRDALGFSAPEDYIQTARPHLHIFNITAVLTQLDGIIIEKLKLV